MAMKNSSGDDKLYDFIREDAIYRFNIIVDYIRNKFGPGEILSRIERYRARYIPAEFQ
jgi:hypothetical protein